MGRLIYGRAMQIDTGKQALEEALAAVAANVRLLRSLRGMTQAELAKAAGVQRQFIWNIERRTNGIEPRLNTLARVAESLGVSVSQITRRIELVAGPSGVAKLE